MNILMYFGNQLNPNNGGTERVACLISDYLMKQGHNLVYLACFPSEKPGNIPCEFLPAHEETPVSENISYIKKLICKYGIDVIINESGNSDAIFLFSHEHISENVKIITHLHFDILGDTTSFYKSLNLPLRNVSLLKAIGNVMRWVKSPYNKWNATRKKKQRYSYMYENSDRIVVLTKRHLHDFQTFIGETSNNKKLTYVTNPITFETQCNVCSTSQDKENIILFVGRLDYPKRIDRILRVWSAIQNHPEWSLHIVGDGKDARRLKQMCCRLKLRRVIFTGQTDPEPYYHKAKILLMTSNYEGTPMVITEAMAYGVVPVIMDSFSGAESMIDNNINGILTPKFDVRKMGDTCRCLMEDEQLCRKMSYEARRRITSIDNKVLLSQWETLIRE